MVRVRMTNGRGMEEGEREGRMVRGEGRREGQSGGRGGGGASYGFIQRK